MQTCRFVTIYSVCRHTLVFRLLFIYLLVTTTIEIPPRRRRRCTRCAPWSGTRLLLGSQPFRAATGTRRGGGGCSASVRRARVQIEPSPPSSAAQRRWLSPASALDVRRLEVYWMEGGGPPAAPSYPERRRRQRRRQARQQVRSPRRWGARDRGSREGGTIWSISSRLPPIIPIARTQLAQWSNAEQRGIHSPDADDTASSLATRVNERGYRSRVGVGRALVFA